MYDSSSPHWSKRRKAIYPLKVLEIQTISRAINHSNVNLIETDSCLKEMNIFYGLLKVTALHHVIRDFKTGKFVFSIWSLPTLYFVVNFSILIYLFYFSASRGFGIKTQENFEDAIMFYQFYVFNVLLLIPVITFFESKKMSDYRNKWSIFQAKYTLFTGKILYLKMRSTVIFAICNVFINPSLCIYYAVTRIFVQTSHASWEVAILSGYFGYILLMAGFAYVHWYIIMTAIRKMAIIFTSDIKGFENKESKMSLLEYKDLWVDFSRLIRATGTTFCYTISLLLVFMFVLLTLASYSTLSQLNGGDIGWLDITLTCSYTVAIFIYLSLIGVSADNAVKSAGEDFQNALLELKSHSLLEENKKYLEQFLQVLSATPPVIDLGGFVVVNKSLNTSLMSTLVTYLIVLLQFKFSSPATKQPQ